MQRVQRQVADLQGAVDGNVIKKIVRFNPLFQYSCVR